MNRRKVYLDFDDSDDFDFIFIVRSIANNVWAQSGARALTIVKIDSWFGPKWHKFSGKALGAVGLRLTPLTVPPFHPRRVVSQMTFKARDYKPTWERPLVHAWIPSESNFRRKFDDISPDAPAMWFSGNTKTNGRGAMMVYARERLDTYAWYAGWVKTNDTWLPTPLRAISRRELHELAVFPRRPASSLFEQPPFSR